MIRVRTNPLRLERVTKDIAKDIEASKKLAMTRTVLAGVEIIEDRTSKGRGINGPFKRYSEAWARIRKDLGKTSATPNLEFGYERVGNQFKSRPSMLSAMQGRADSKKSGIIFFTNREAGKRAAFNNKSRPFFGFNRKEERRLADVYLSGIKIKDRRR